MPSEDIILGIDLGTTFSAVACVDRNGKTTVLPNCDGAPTTASVIHFVDESSFVIGDEAIKAVVADPSHVARFFKRQMGQADQSFEFYGRRYTPQELTAILLRKLKEDSEEALGQPVRDVVLTVPAYFNAAQRGATAEAGTIAGLNVLSMINEPTAAAIAYGISHLGRDRRLFIFDLGGGTFDVTVMQVEGSALKTIASDGIAELGGKDWDERLVDRVAEIFKSRYNVDPRDDVQVYQELYERCLQSKIAVSTQPQVVVPVNYGGHRAGVQVTQADFSRLCADLVEQCTDTCALVLEKANLSWSDIGELVLVGGSTRMPMVREALHRISGLFPAEGVNPDECVALGAALAGVFRHCPGHPALNKVVRSAATRPATGPVRDAGPFVLRTGASRPAERSEEFTDEYTDPSLPTLTITDAATHPLGIIALEPSLEERVVNLIPEGTPLPVERKGRFAYAFDNMTAVRVEVTEGVGVTRDEVMVIGEVVLSDLPPRPRGTRIDVVYRYRLDQLLEVDITDVETRITRRASIHLKGALSPEQVAAAREHIAQIRIL